MKRAVVGGVTLLVIVWAVAAAVVAERSPGREDEATSAAMNYLFGSDPPRGVGASCEYSPDLGAVLLRARYRCQASDCFKVTDRLDVTHRAFGGWSPASPAYGATPTLDRDSCPGG